jgi:pyruvate kinase
MIRTKILATMGPATADAEVLYRLFDEGVDICRLNFSHGTLDEHKAMLDKIRAAAERYHHPIAVLGDLCGPKIRLGKVADVDGRGGMPIRVGEELTFQREPVVGANGRVSCTYPHFIDDVNVGDRVLIEDGMLRFLCTEKTPSELRCVCKDGGVVKSSKGINLPDSQVSVPSITDKDWEGVEWAIANDLDYLALSFVRSAKDLHLLREHLRNKVSDIHLVAKIEKPQAIADIDNIIEASDGLMVARGDLGVEMDVALVPIMQKDIIRRCQAAGKPVIVATQMLQSMIEESTPTRAEVSDVANAIFDGTDAVMLSGETSVGKYPVVAVHTMAHIATETEKYIASVPEQSREPNLKLKTMHLSVAVARGVWQIVKDLKVTLVVIWSQTGSTARIFSKHRFPIPIVALSSDQRALRRMALHYGVYAQAMQPPADMAALVDQVDRYVQEKKFADPGDRIVVVAGSSLGTPSTMNGIVIHTLGESWLTTPAGGAPAQLALGIENT